MKKCLIVSTVSRQFTLFERGNIQVLKKLGYEIHCVANFEDATKQLKELGIIEHHIDIQRSPYALKNIKAYKQLKSIINSDEFELMHCHSPMGGVLARLAARKARKKGMKVIYTAHGFHFYKGAPLLNWLTYYPVERFLSRYTDCLITINQEDYDIANKKFKARKVELVHGIGVDENKFNFEMTKEEKHELRESLNLKDDDFVISQIGELNKNKNQIMAILAMRSLVKENKKIHLLLAGKGKNQEFYEKKIKEFNLQENVHLLGYRTDIPKIIKISDILLSLSYREGLPVNVIEGMMCNIPIIATDCRGNRDLVDNRYIIQINDIKKLKEAVLNLIQNNDYIQNNNLDIYSMNSVKKVMNEIYSSVIGVSIK